MILYWALLIILYHNLNAAVVPTAFTMRSVSVADVNPFEQSTSEPPRGEDAPMQTSISYEIVPELDIEYNSDPPSDHPSLRDPILNVAEIPLKAGPIPVVTDNPSVQPIDQNQFIKPALLLYKAPQPVNLVSENHGAPTPQIADAPPIPVALKEAGPVFVTSDKPTGQTSSEASQPVEDPGVHNMPIDAAPLNPISTTINEIVDPSKSPIPQVVIEPNPIISTIQEPVDLPKSPIPDANPPIMPHPEAIAPPNPIISTIQEPVDPPKSPIPHEIIIAPNPSNSTIQEPVDPSKSPIPDANPPIMPLPGVIIEPNPIISTIQEPVDPSKSPIPDVIIAPNPIIPTIQEPVDPPKSPKPDVSMPSAPQSNHATTLIKDQSNPESIKVYPIYYMENTETSSTADLLYSDPPIETDLTVSDLIDLLVTDPTYYDEEHQFDESIEQDPCVNYSCVGCVPGPAQDEYVCQSCRHLRANHCY